MRVESLFLIIFIVPTRRGDLEILAYNIIHWLGGQLPWDNNLKDPNVVQQSKENAMNDVKSFVESCFDSLDSNVPSEIKKKNMNRDRIH